MQISYKLNEINSAAESFWQYAHNYKVICFDGSMGAGKTTFIAALCRYLGVNEDEISSPTFSIINEYTVSGHQQFNRILHMDWYRLRDEEEGMQAGVLDALMSSNTLCLVEWPEKCHGLLPVNRLTVNISDRNEEERMISLEQATFS